MRVVDDRSGGAYPEYHCAYGEAVEVALRFLFNAMAPKADARCPLAGRPAALSMENGPGTRSHVFHQVRDSLGIEVQTHLPRGHDGRRTTARAKGKVERPFRTVKEAHETLYHFHVPQTAAEANAWLWALDNSIVEPTAATLRSISNRLRGYLAWARNRQHRRVPPRIPPREHPFWRLLALGTD